jgi:hypothetical protein
VVIAATPELARAVERDGGVVKWRVKAGIAILAGE